MRTQKGDGLITLTINVERESPVLRRLYFDLGTAACNMHVKDCHWFTLRESPTNIIFFPLYLFNISFPLNLKTTVYNKHSTISKYIYIEWESTLASHKMLASICT